VIPLSSPVTTSTGEIVTSIVIKKGTVVSSPIRAINRSEAFWGPNAKEFVPERWLEDGDTPAKEISGPRHILTFSDGPRLCLGRSFALAEFKVSDNDLPWADLNCFICVRVGSFISLDPKLHIRSPGRSYDED
jgi:cytochrome P450